MAKAKLSKKKNEGPDIRAFFEYIQDVSTDKGLNREEVLEVIRSSLLTAYQRKYGAGAELEVILDQEKPEVKVIAHFSVLDEVDDPERELTLDEAKKIDPEAQVGTKIQIAENPFDFSRIGATNVRQILMQRLKELEREIIYNEFHSKVGELMNGYFLRWRDRDLMYIDLGRAEGMLPRREQIPGEKFRPGDRVKAIVKSVELRREKSREPGPFITLSRASGSFVQKLFEMEIPEIYDGVVEILAISRIAGSRTKILVHSNRSDVDPVGACVGIKGVRIQSIVRELGNERIDIVNYSEDQGELIGNALSPARVMDVKIDQENKEALVIVSDETYSQAIGNGGHNVKLASQLTGYRLIVKSQTIFADEISNNPEARARLDAIFQKPELVENENREEESDYTHLSELPGLSQRVIGILEGAGINSVEQLVEMEAEELNGIADLDKHTAKQIERIIAESVEYEEDDEAEVEQVEDVYEELETDEQQELETEETESEEVENSPPEQGDAFDSEEEKGSEF